LARIAENIAMTQSSTIELTHHGRTRSQQRGIGSAAIEALLCFGSSAVHGGREVVFLDNAGRRKAREALGRVEYARIEPRLDVYLVLTESGALLTCAHRRKPLRFKH
jgi:hypothetical protein